MIKKDLSAKWCFGLAAALLILKLVLTYGQSVYLYEPVAAKLDDTLMLESAISISQGQWLGEYGYLTLSKYMFFPVWLALVHILGVPYLMAGQLLWATACAVCVYAFMPLIKQNIWRLGLFTVLLYNPAISAAKVQLRAYRDNIFPALCLLCVAGAVGAAVRYKAALKGFFICLFICGVGLATAYTTREDGVWIAAFAVPALICTAVYIYFDKDIQNKAKRFIGLFIPFLITGIFIFSFCFMNYMHYGRFILSDFTSAEFKAAYGSMTRVKHTNWKPKIAVPFDVRQNLYDYVPELALLEPLMETAPVYSAYGTGEKGDETELSSAGYYWALRQIAHENGVYINAQTAKSYWQSVADKINALCDDGTLAAGAKRASTLSPFNIKYTAPLASEKFKNIGRILVFAEAEPAFDHITIGHGTPELLRYEEFLKEKSNSAAVEGQSEPYYSTKQKMAHFALAFIRAIYAFLLPVAFLLAMAWLIACGISMLKNKSIQWLLPFITALGLLLAGILRCGIVGYMFVSSFNDNVEKIMYLASAHPLFIIFAFYGAYMFFAQRLYRRQGV